MKTKNFVTGILCLGILLVVVFALTSKSQKPEEEAKPETILIDTGHGADSSLETPTRIAVGHPPDTIRGYDIIDIGTGGCPRFSPDSKKIAFLSGGWVCVKNSDGRGLTEKIAQISALDFQWMTDSSIIYWNQERYGTSKVTRSIIILTLKGEDNPVVAGVDEDTERVEPPIFLPDGTIGLYRKGTMPGTRYFKVIKPGSLPPDSALKQLRARVKPSSRHVMYGDIYLVSVDGSFKKQITFNKTFEFPELSPDGKKILATKSPDGDPYLGGGPYLIDLKGHEIYLGEADIWTPVKDSTGRILGHSIEGASGSGAKLSPDGSKVVYQYGKTDPILEDVVASDLVIKNVDGTGRVQIETPHIIEASPVWSLDGKMIACETDNTNKILVIRLR